MSEILGTNVSAQIAPWDTEDSFSTHDSKYGKGGWREVSTIEERDAVTTQRRTAGMIVYVTANNTPYILNNDLVTWREFLADEVGIIQRNGEELPIVNKTVNIEVPTKISDITDDTETYPVNKADTLTDLTATVSELNILDGATITTQELNYVDGTTSNIQTQINSKVNTSDVINNVISTDINKPLSANMGKELQDEINNLKSLGTYLSDWNCVTGLANTDPTTSPRAYHSGDYFMVGTVAPSGGTNYKPSGSEYVIGQASTVVETEEVNVGDVYAYDGTNWILQLNTRKTITFASIAGQPTDNTNLATALNAKQDTLSPGTLISINNNTVSFTGTIPTKISDLTDDTSTTPIEKANTLTDLTATITELNYTDGVTSNIQTQLNGKQETLVSGTNIKTVNSNSLLGEGNVFIDTGVMDVKMNGTTVVTQGTANIPKATSNTLGVVKPDNSSISINSDGELYSDIGNGTITIKQGTITKGTFTTNQDASTTITLDSFEIPSEIKESMITMASNTVYLTDSCSIYYYTVNSDTAFYFNTSSLGSLTNKAVTFELYLNMPNVRTLSFPNNVVWVTQPTISVSGKYLFAFKTLDGGDTWLGNLEVQW